MFRIIIFVVILLVFSSSHLNSYPLDYSDSSKTIIFNDYKDSDLSDYRFVIHSIRILGNRKTKEQTILKELKLDENNSISLSELKYFEQRILSLGIFNDVKALISQESDKNVLIILVQESWYIWPLPFINIADRDWSKITYGMNLLIQNFTGRNENLNLGFSFGYDPKFYLSYYNPNFSFDNNLIFKIQTSLQRRKSKSIRAFKLNNKNYDEDYFNFEFGLGRRIDIYNLIFASTSFEYLKVEEYLPLRTVSPNGIDRFISLQVSYSFDTRDFSAYPKSGTNINLSYRKAGLGESRVNHNILAVELKKIFSIYYPIFYFRNYSRLLFGPSLPYYANSFIGYRERLRGNFHQVYESNSLTFTNFEIRLPLIEKYILQFDFSLIPKELLTYNLNIDFHFFFDNAFMFDKNQDLNSVRALNGFGFGLSFLFLPYRAVNLELAWNQKLNSQIIFDLNFPF